jgi:rRNA biogenesis protein RRP5
VTSVGLFCALSSVLKARVKIKEISDDYIADWQSHWKPGQCVKAKVISVDEQGKVELSLKKSALGESEPIEVGMCLDGQVSKVMDYGVFISLGSGKQGLCHRSEVKEGGMEAGTLSTQFSVGDRVRVKVLRVDEKGMSLGMKYAYFENETTWQEIDMGGQNEEEDEEVETREIESSLKVDEFSWSLPTLKDAMNSAPAVTSSSTTNDFEKNLLSNPNSSYHWIQYMSHHLSLSNIDEARNIATRALATIQCTMEKEKRNVWIAWMNLEGHYGNASSLETVLEEAYKNNDPLEIGLHYLKMCEPYPDKVCFDSF